MTDDEQLARFGEAVEDKKEDAKARSEQSGEQNPGDGAHIDGDQESLVEHGREQDVRDERAKNSGHGKVTADKWNQ